MEVVGDAEPMFWMSRVNVNGDVDDKTYTPFLDWVVGELNMTLSPIWTLYPSMVRVLSMETREEEEYTKEPNEAV